MSSFFLKFSGKVVPGKKRGWSLGFPTLNISVPQDFGLDCGVYVSRVKTPLGIFLGALHYGSRETFGEKEPSIEVHLLDFKGNLYGEKVEIEVLQKIREVRVFSDAKSLKQQIAEDVAAVRGLVV
ncbi:riboflavin kinase [Candidatus Peregrinibacteria bacterium]|nr:riboflavin kinase [Candidatus Peregrinibacteria bacterium]